METLDTRWDLYRELAQVVEQTADSVIITDLEGVIEYVNPAFEALTGYTRDEVLGKSPRILKSDQHEENFYRDLWETILMGAPYQSVMVNRKKTGHLFYSAKVITPLLDRKGKIVRFVSTDRDVTENKLLADELNKLRLEEERLGILRTLSSTYAHHIFNAITPISGYADLILRKGHLAGDHRIWLDEIKKNVDRVVELVHQMEEINEYNVTSIAGVNILDITKKDTGE